MLISQALDFDPVWMGLLMLISISHGLPISPFGLPLFIMKGNITALYSFDICGNGLIHYFPGHCYLTASIYVSREL